MRPEIPILSFLSIISLPLPLFYYLRSGNVAMVAHILWLLCLDITYAVDAIVWANNVDKVATVWCDITTKLVVGWPTALTATCLAFCMRLAVLVSKADEITPTEAYRRRRNTQYREAALCLGLPLVIMAIHCAFQSRRFAIIEDFGCRPSTFVTPLSILFIWCTPLVLAFLTIACAVFVAIRWWTVIRARIDTYSVLDLANRMRMIAFIIASIYDTTMITATTLADFLVAVPNYRPLSALSKATQLSLIDTYTSDSITNEHFADLTLNAVTVATCTVVFCSVFYLCHPDISKEARVFVWWIRKRLLRQDIPQPRNSPPRLREPLWIWQDPRPPSIESQDTLSAEAVDRDIPPETAQDLPFAMTSDTLVNGSHDSEICVLPIISSLKVPKPAHVV